MNDDILLKPFLPYDEVEESLCWRVCETPPTRDFYTLLEDLHVVFGSGFVWTLKEIAAHSEFKPLPNDANIYTVGGETAKDYDNLLNAARKAVEHGYRVFILPNPKGIRTADFIFERKGVFKMFDLKTIMGKASVSNRLLESIGQTNRVLLNMNVDYNPIALARNIKKYFEKNSNAVEIMIFKGHKILSVIREDTENKNFHKLFIAKYIK